MANAHVHFEQLKKLVDLLLAIRNRKIISLQLKYIRYRGGRWKVRLTDKVIHRGAPLLKTEHEHIVRNSVKHDIV